MQVRQRAEQVDNGIKGVVRDVEDVLDMGYPPEFRQFQRKNNVQVAHLYSIYLSGKSVRYIANVMYRGRFSHQALTDMFKVRGYKLRSKKLRPGRVYKGVTYRPDGFGHYRSRMGGRAVYLHRLIWEEVNGPIPADHVLIFLDGNKENITVENMRCIHREEAKKFYNYGNQFGYKKFPDKGQFGK